MGERGEKGERGERGERGPARRWGPLYGYLAASAIFTVVVYALLFQVRSELLSSCHRVNDVRVAFNAHVAEDTKHLSRHDGPYVSNPIPLTDCEAEFSKPIPFSWF